MSASTTGADTVSSGLSGLTQSTAGRGGATRGRGSRRGARSGRGRGNATNTRNTRGPAFKGSTPEMAGNVFECYEEKGDTRQYRKTLEALGSYAKKTCKFPQDLAPLFADDMKEPSIAKPSNPAKDADETDKAIWNEELKEYMKRTRELKNNFAAIHAVAWGQCSEAMKAKVKSHSQYAQRTEANDCFWLLNQVRAVTLQFDETKYAFISSMDARANFLNCRQGQDESAEDYLEKVRAWASAIEHHGGTVSESHTLIPPTDASGKLRSIEERKRLAMDHTLAAAVIRGADKTRFGTLITGLANQFALGKNDYPTDATAAYGLLVNYVTPVNQAPNRHHGNSSSTPATSTSSSLTTSRVSSSLSTAPPNGPSGSGITFAQRGTTAGTDGVTHDGITCYNCQAAGHYSPQCPNPTIAATTLAQYGVMLAQTKYHGIDPNWILLDSQSTISVFNNKSMLTNLRPSGHVIRAITNGGFQDSDTLGDFPQLGTVWYNQESIANILSLSAVRKLCRVTMDTSAEPSMLVHRNDGSVMKFTEHPSGLYVFHPPKVCDPRGYTMLSTVADHKKLFTPRQIADADAARALYRKLGRPDESEFLSILKKNLIRNCPVTHDDAKRAMAIYGPDVAVLKGKMTRSAAAPRIPTFEAVPIPAPLLEHHSTVTLCVDIFFVQGLGYLHTISRNIGYRTVVPIANRGVPTLLPKLRSVLRLYEARGFRVSDIHADREFECLHSSLLPVELNTVAPDSHVGEVERSIRTIKERLRSTVHGLPYKRLPKLLVHSIVSDAVRCLNLFPWKYGISDTLSPDNIVRGTALPDFPALRLELGAYVQVFEDCAPSNTPRARSLGAIALHPTGNAQGDYFFLSLATGSRISRHTWTELPIPDTAIARVEALALHERQPLVQARGFVVEWRPDHPIDPDEYDLDYDASAPRDAPDDVFDPDDYDPIDADELAALADDTFIFPVDPALAPALPAPGAPEHPHDQHEYNIDDDNEPIPNANADDDANTYDEDADNLEANTYDEDTADLEEPGAYAFDDPNEPADLEEPGAYAPDEPAPDAGAPADGAGAHIADVADEHLPEGANPVVAADEPVVPATPPYNLRARDTNNTANFLSAIDSPYSTASYYPPRQFAQYSERNDFVLDPAKRYAVDYVLTQMSAKAGIRKHGKAAEAALMAEFAQLEALEVYEPIDASTLTPKQKSTALRAINLIKEKRDGRLKGRTVADGRAQRGLYSKSETSSPTVSTDALMLSMLIDAHERRDVATANVAGAYLKADMDDFVVMKFTGYTVRMLCDMNPSHRDYVVNENGTTVLYVRLAKALYGCVKSAYLWYHVFSGTLQKLGFVLNPYDQCIANRDINGSQCTIAWYVDDTKISHADPAVVSDVIATLESHFDKMTVTRGDEHTFLGMRILFDKKKGTAEISMKNYLIEAIEESGMGIAHTATTPANKELFDIDTNAALLDTRSSDAFHRVVAKLLYVSTRARVDLLLTVAFLSTRVTKSTSQDQRKLKRLLEYIRGSIDLTYTLGADDLTRFRTWVDASYAVHHDMRSHTGGVVSFGRGGLFCKSFKQRLNTKSSTEGEIVGASDFFPNTLWTKMFMEAQGYRIQDAFFEQDNESAIRLETNGRASAGAKSRHIHIRYFWIKDRASAEGITIRHCPTLAMLADFFTKPLQGALFRKFRDVLMGREHVNALIINPSAPEERVGNGQASTANEDNDTSTDKHSTVTSTDKHSTVGSKLKETGKHIHANATWADVVRFAGRPAVSRAHSLETIQLTKSKV